MTSASLQTQSVPIPGDWEPDGDVDLVDLAVMVGEWLQTGENLVADIYPFGGDQIVNLWDFSVLAERWLEQSAQ